MQNSAHENPFKTISTSKPFVDARCTVRRDEFILDDGFRGVHLVIEIPEAVCVVPVLPDGRILLLRQWRYTISQRLWEVPAGRMHAGESVEAAAARELREETGHTAGRFVHLGDFYPLTGISNHRGHLLAALDCKYDGTLQLEPTERIEVVPTDRSGVEELYQSFAIQDGFAMAALSRYLMTTRGARP
ncbi:MAG: NUDIX hydrolase [Planctomycetota bacterium]